MIHGHDYRGLIQLAPLLSQVCSQAKRHIRVKTRIFLVQNNTWSHGSQQKSAIPVMPQAIHGREPRAQNLAYSLDGKDGIVFLPCSQPIVGGRELGYAEDSGVV